MSIVLLGPILMTQRTEKRKYFITITLSNKIDRKKLVHKELQFLEVSLNTVENYFIRKAVSYLYKLRIK